MESRGRHTLGWPSAGLAILIPERTEFERRHASCGWGSLLTPGPASGLGGQQRRERGGSRAVVARVHHCSLARGRDPVRWCRHMRRAQRSCHCAACRLSKEFLFRSMCLRRAAAGKTMAPRPQEHSRTQPPVARGSISAACRSGVFTGSAKGIGTVDDEPLSCSKMGFASANQLCRILVGVGRRVSM